MNWVRYHEERTGRRERKQKHICILEKHTHVMENQVCHKLLFQIVIGTQMYKLTPVIYILMKLLGIIYISYTKLQ